MTEAKSRGFFFQTTLLSEGKTYFNLTRREGLPRCHVAAEAEIDMLAKAKGQFEPYMHDPYVTLTRFSVVSYSLLSWCVHRTVLG